jgi:ribokinase
MLASALQRIAVVGHVEHVTIGRAPSVPLPGEITHLQDPFWIPGGGGGIAFGQFVRGPGEVHLFTAIGNDEAGRDVLARVEAAGARVHAARRDEPHTRDVCIITPDGQRTIVVVGEPLHPRRDDPLPWDVLATCDAAYFTAQDPAALREARRARLLVVTARRAEALARSGVRADIVVGSALDLREASTLAGYTTPPDALVMTDGADGGAVSTAQGVARFAASPPPTTIAGTYGAGDTFAAALTWYAARGLALLAACARAAEHAAAVLRCIDPLECQAELE